MNTAEQTTCVDFPSPDHSCSDEISENMDAIVAPVGILFT